LDRLHQALQTELEASRAVAQLSKQAYSAAGASSPIATNPKTGLEGPAVDGEVSVASSTAGEREPLLARRPGTSIGNSAELIFAPTDLSKVEITLDPNMFYEPGYDRVLGELIEEVLRQEAPILDKSLVDRVARAHGFMRSGRIIRERVLDIARCRFHFQPNVGGDGSFLWLSEDDRLRWLHHRVPMAGGHVRPIDEIAPEEIVSAAERVVGDDPPLQIARIFGIRRLSSEGRSRIQSILQAALTGG
jgi:hypothetical protein